MESKLNINLFKIPTDCHGVEVPVLQNQLECSDLQKKKPRPLTSHSATQPQNSVMNNAKNAKTEFCTGINTSN